MLKIDFQICSLVTSAGVMDSAIAGACLRFLLRPPLVRACSWALQSQPWLLYACSLSSLSHRKDQALFLTPHLRVFIIDFPQSALTGHALVKRDIWWYWIENARRLILTSVLTCLRVRIVVMVLVNAEDELRFSRRGKGKEDDKVVSQPTTSCHIL